MGSDEEKQSLLKSCPATCGLCPRCIASNITCCDDWQFLDEKRYACAFWVGHNCSDAVDSWGYSTKAKDDLLANCSASCALCQRRPSVRSYRPYRKHESAGSSLDMGSTVFIIVCIAVIVFSIAG